VKSKKAGVPAKIDIGLSDSVLSLLIQSYFFAGCMTDDGNFYQADVPDRPVLFGTSHPKASPALTAATKRTVTNNLDSDPNIRLRLQRAALIRR
jgi:hypothetical protein